MTSERDAGLSEALRLGAAGGLDLSDARESAWQEVIKRVEEVYSDLVRYECDLERKNAELEDAQAFISSVIASVSDILVVCDGAGAIVQANPAFQRLVGCDLAALTGSSLAVCLIEDDRARAVALIDSGAEGAAAEGELRFATGQGASDFYAVVCSARFDHLGRRAGAVLTGRPIGELRRAYEALHQAHLELQQAQAKLIEQEKMASLGRLVAGVAHELNNPISFIYGNIHSLDRYRQRLERYFGELDAAAPDVDPVDLRRRHRIDAILDDLSPLVEGTLEGAQRISEIVRNLRRLSFAASGVAQDVDLERIVRTAANWAARAKRARAQVAIDVEPGLTLRGDEGQLHQIALNLIDNALDAVRGVADPQVRVSARRLDGAVEWIVRDNGPGIDAKALGKVFEPFFTTKTVGEGTGLGLWISYTIVTEHGGAISARNEPGGGAAFVVRLPAVGPAAA